MYLILLLFDPCQRALFSIQYKYMPSESSDRSRGVPRPTNQEPPATVPRAKSVFGSQVGVARPRYHVREDEVRADDSVSQMVAQEEESQRSTIVNNVLRQDESAVLNLVQLQEKAEASRKRRMGPAEYDGLAFACAAHITNL